MEEPTWRGVPIMEIYGSQSPWGVPEFPLVVPGTKHTVLYYVTSGGSSAEDSPPKPIAGSDVWNHDFVRMPCSSQSLYPVTEEHGVTRLKKKWKIVEDTLSKPIRNSEELANAILSYNTKFKQIWKFRALHALFNEYLDEDESEYFFNVTLPEIARLALALPKLVQAPIPLLKQNSDMSISLSQQQISSLLANAFFCTFPKRNTTKKSSEYISYPHINFNRLYNSSGSDSVLEKLKCICHYFRRVTTKVPTGVVTFSRRSRSDTPSWTDSEVPIAGLPLHVDSGVAIEDLHGLIQVDFANKYLGGGVLNYGCVQEEIRFVICPELMISMLLTEVLLPNEALMMLGGERYSSYTGYGKNFQWSEDYRDQTPRDCSGRLRVAVLAIDALPHSDPNKQYTQAALNRDLDKAWVGVSFGIDEHATGLQRPGVATGNWGCGAFGGNPRVKWLLQLLACVQTGRPLAYCSYHDASLRDFIYAQYCLLSRHNVTVGKLYNYIMEYSMTDLRQDLHSFLEHKMVNDNKPKWSPRPEKLENTSVVTPMDVSEPETPLSTLVQSELQNSPDLFSQDNVDSSVSEMKSDCESEMNDLMDAAERGELSDHSTTNVDNTPTASRNKEKAPKQKLRLFEEIQKFDDENGRLNLTGPHTSPLKQSRKTPMDHSTVAINDEKIQIDVSPEVKRKMSKKITDYFSKKPL